jgi:glutamate synthase (NADPH/NADH) small chain
MEYNIDEIQEYADYCLNCKAKPCQKGCPLGNDIPQFIMHVKNKEYEDAYKVLTKTTVMPHICGRICPKSKQCQGKCVRGIKSNPVQIGKIETFLGDLAIENGWTNLVKESNKKSTKNIAIIGAGPAGITASILLARKGYQVTVYEKHKDLGGILTHGIPDFRLGDEYVKQIENNMKSLEIHIEYETPININNIQELKEQYDAIFISIGANVSCTKPVDGKDLPHVLGAYELLETNSHPDYTNKKVVILGGGNVAMDSCRTVKRLGAKEVSVIYRRKEEQMPAEKEEIEEAKSEGICFLFQVDIKKIDKGSIECIRTELIKKEGEDREFPVEIENSEFMVEADYVIIAIGSKFDKKGVKESNLILNEKGYIQIDENYMTNIQGIFAGGDCIGTEATVAWASRNGREAAEKIDEYLSKE